MLYMWYSAWWALNNDAVLLPKRYPTGDWRLEDIIHTYTFPWLCVWEGCIIILLALGRDVESVLTHPTRHHHSMENTYRIWAGLRGWSGLIPAPAAVIMEMYSGIAGFYSFLSGTVSSVLLRLSQFSQLSFMQYMGLCVLGLPNFPMKIVRICIFYLISIIKSDVWPICHCL